MNISIRTKNTPSRVRGYIRRFLTEIDHNFFVGICSKRVADNLWNRITAEEFLELHPKYRATLVYYTAINEQGFAIVSFNPSNKFTIVENQGLYLFGKINQENT